MNTYSFNSEIAKHYGLDSAVFIHYLYFWIEKNAANGSHTYEDKTWTYNSAEALAKLFPFWSSNKIDKLIRSMEKKGQIFTGNFNKNKFDRTRWFALSDDILNYYRALDSVAALPFTEKENDEKGDHLPFSQSAESIQPNGTTTEAEFSQISKFPDFDRFSQMAESNPPNCGIHSAKPLNPSCRLADSDSAKRRNPNNQMAEPIPVIDPFNYQVVDPVTTDPPFSEIKNRFNEICTKLPPLKVVSASMKQEIRSRIESGYTVQDFAQLFEMTQASDYLTGKTKPQWRATFDWLIQEKNMAKVLNGNYQNAQRDSSYDMEKLERLITYQGL